MKSMIGVDGHRRSSVMPLPSEMGAMVERRKSFLASGSSRGLRQRHTVEGSVVLPPISGKFSSRASISSASTSPGVSPGVSPEPKGKQGTFAEASLLVRQFDLDLDQVQLIIDAFHSADEDDSNSLDKDEFRVALADVLALRKVSPATLEENWEALIRAAAQFDRVPVTAPEKFLWVASIECFAAWYIATVFRVKAGGKQPLDAQERIDLAFLHNVPTTAIDEAKAEFDLSDVDGSGFLSFEEFEKMTSRTLLRGKSGGAFQEHVQRLWANIDGNESGIVRFDEFALWYLNNFGTPSEKKVSHQTTGRRASSSHGLRKRPSWN